MGGDESTERFKRQINLRGQRQGSGGAGKQGTPQHQADTVACNPVKGGAG
jgi:hypothetical protein